MGLPKLLALTWTRMPIVHCSNCKLLFKLEQAYVSLGADVPCPGCAAMLIVLAVASGSRWGWHARWGENQQAEAVYDRVERSRRARRLAWRQSQ